MASKKPSFKAQAPAETSLSQKLKKKWWIVLLLAIFVFVTGSIAYNKYLDYRNVEDMKALLSDFQELEKAMKKDVGDTALVLETNCESVGKFAESFACYLYLVNEGRTDYTYDKYIPSSSSLTKPSNRCKVIKSPDAKYFNSYSCIISVRHSNREPADNIF